jgi:hypothetical protein
MVVSRDVANAERIAHRPLVSGLLQFIGWLRPLWKTSPTAYRALLVWTLQCKTLEGATSRKAKRLAEIYIERLAPAVHYLCEKMEFLILKNFDTAWRVLLRFDESKTFIKAVGGEEFKTEVRLQFQQAAVRGPGSLTILVSRIFTMNCKSSPLLGGTRHCHWYALCLRGCFSKPAQSTGGLPVNFFDGFPEPFLKGDEDGIEVFCDCGSVDSPLFAGLQIVKRVLFPVLGNNLRKQDKQVPGEEKSDHGGCGETLAEDRQFSIRTCCLALLRAGWSHAQ